MFACLLSVSGINFLLFSSCHAVDTRVSLHRIGIGCGAEYSDECVCLSVFTHIPETTLPPIFAQNVRCVACGSGLVCLWRLVMYFRFVDDVVISYDGPYGGVTLRQQLATICARINILTSVLRGIGCALA